MECRRRFVSRQIDIEGKVKSSGSGPRRPVPEDRRGPDEPGPSSSEPINNLLRDPHKEHGVQRRFHLQRVGAIWRTLDSSASGYACQEQFRIWYSVRTASWPMALSGPPPLTAAGVLLLSRVVEGEPNYGLQDRRNCCRFIPASTIRFVRSSARVEEVSGKLVPVGSAPRRHGDAAVLVADIRKIRESLGWKPTRCSLDEIVGTAWLWYSEFQLVV